MFDKKTVELYKSIRAPEALRQRVEKMQSEYAVSTPFSEEQVNSAYKKEIFAKKYRISSLAACAAALYIVFAAVLAIPKNTRLSVNGDVAGTAPIAISGSAETALLAAARMTPAENLSCELFIETDFDTVLSVSKGTLSSENTSGLQNVTVNSDTSFIWNLSEFYAGDTAVLKIESGGKEKNYIVYFDKDAGQWLLKEY